MPKRLNDVCVGHHLDDEKVLRAQKAMTDGLTATRLAQIFRGLSDPSRVRIMSALRAGEVSVYDIATVVGMTQSAVSHQLATLREAGLVKFRKTGRKVFYSLCDESLARILDIALEENERQ